MNGVKVAEGGAGKERAQLRMLGLLRCDVWHNIRWMSRDYLYSFVALHILFSERTNARTQTYGWIHGGRHAACSDKYV
jgi:hypothetical protein